MRRWLCAALLLALPAAGAAQPRCGLATAVHLVGLDTGAERTLLALSAPDGATHLVSWRPGDEAARSVPEPPGPPRFGGSTGPGPVFVFQRCGEGCIQAVRLEGGSWEPLGDALTAPPGATAHGTYDRRGTPWVVFHTRGEGAGRRQASAFHLGEDGWRPAGTLAVTAAGVPGATPAPARDDAVVSGTGLFRAGGRSELWIRALPAGAAGSGARLVPLGPGRAALVGPDGAVYRTGDGGATWSRATWSPWATGSAAPWQPGRDYSVDLATGPAAERLSVVWFDRRLPGRESVIYSEMSGSGAWREIARGPGRIPTSAGDDLAASLVLRGSGQRWSTLFGCVRSGGGPRLVVTLLDGEAMGSPELVPVRATLESL